MITRLSSRARIRRLTFASALALMLSMLLLAQAHASPPLPPPQPYDAAADQDPVVTLVPHHQALAPGFAGGVTPMSVTHQADYDIAVLGSGGLNNGWARIRDVPDQFDIGGAQAGWTFSASEADTASSPQAYFGWFGGGLQGCGWVTTSAVANNRTQTVANCNGGSSLSPSDYQSYWDGCTGSSCGGTYINSYIDWAKPGCSSITELANARPWTTTVFGDALRSISQADGHALYWRYESKDGKSLMVRDGNVPSADGNWVFVNATCFAQLPAYAGGLSPPHR